MTQHEKILEILKASGSKGMNSYEYRMQFIQLPVRIKELKEQGYLITTRTNKNRSVDYILMKAPRIAKKAVEITEEYVWDYSESTAREVLKSSLKPEQTSFL